MSDDWRDRAACIGKAPLFDATIDDGGRYPDEADTARENRYRDAAEVCARCPVRPECEAARIEHDDQGIWAQRLYPDSRKDRARGSRLILTAAQVRAKRNARDRALRARRNGAA